MNFVLTLAPLPSPPGRGLLRDPEGGPGCHPGEEYNVHDGGDCRGGPGRRLRYPARSATLDPPPQMLALSTVASFKSTCRDRPPKTTVPNQPSLFESRAISEKKKKEQEKKRKSRSAGNRNACVYMLHPVRCADPAKWRLTRNRLRRLGGAPDLACHLRWLWLRDGTRHHGRSPRQRPLTRADSTVHGRRDDGVGTVREMTIIFL